MKFAKMETATKSFIIMSILGIITAVYWSVYVFFSNDPFVKQLSLVLNGAWVVGYILIILTATTGGIHIFHRVRS